MDHLPPLKMDKSKIRVYDSFEDAERDQHDYWRNTSYEERLEHAYRLRYMAYGDKIRGTISRVIEVIEPQ